VDRLYNDHLHRRNPLSVTHAAGNRWIIVPNIVDRDCVVNGHVVAHREVRLRIHFFVPRVASPCDEAH
jgi:hypothetical protein